ncbi:DHHA1 domain-containing protein [Candidatus Tisiphia endosymbiont of Piscicola geometra]|uniref:DHHA1 domain-containing protein n=1 Tax=Candidatus Tisiphia endosymbiont of Piscicola geometra TaxID=3066273 RepID=UPI0039776DE3
MSERSVHEVREHANAPKFCGANSSNHLSIQFIYKLVHNLDTKVLRLSAQRIVDKSDNLVIVYIGMPDLQGKLSITIAVSKEISNKVHAGNLAKEVSVFLGGSGGGGQANIAQAGGTDVSKVGKLQDMIRELLSKF